MRRDRRALLDSIVATGERRRVRRRLALSTLGVAVLAVAVAVPLSLAGGDDDPAEQVVAAGADGTESTRADRPPGNADAEQPVDVATTHCEEIPVEGGVVMDCRSDAPDQTIPPETRPADPELIPPANPPSTTVPPPGSCRNSHDPACGPFRWDPEPAANQEMAVTVEVDRTTVAVGQPVTITARADDPDGPARICAVLTHAEVQEPACAFAACAEQERHGPWDPPEPQPGVDTETLVHAYDEPGTYTVSVFAHSYAGPCGLGAYDVFGDDDNATVQITVKA